MYAITNKHGLNSSLFNNLSFLFNELSKILDYYKVNIPSYEDFSKNIHENGYYQINLHNDIYYVIKTDLDKSANIASLVI